MFRERPSLCEAVSHPAVTPEEAAHQRGAPVHAEAGVPVQDTAPVPDESPTSMTDVSAAPKPPKRRIAPIALATAAPAPAAAPAPTAPPAPALVPLDTLDRCIQQSLQSLRDDVNGLLSNSRLVVLDKGMLDELETGVKRVREYVDRYNAAAEASERAAAVEHERLMAELKPVKIERSDTTKRIYADNQKVLAGERRYLYKCPCADAMGICKPPNARRKFRPAARNNVMLHIEAWHFPQDKLRGYRLNNAFWSEGADAQRAKAPRKA